MGSALARADTQPPAAELGGEFGELYAEHAAFLARTIARLVGPGPHVDDLLQDTFLVAFRKRADFEGRSAPRTWLYGIAARLCLRYRRGRGRFRRFQDRLARASEPPPPAAPDADWGRRRAKELVWEVIAELPHKQREAFVLYELEELEGQEIAELLHIPIGTVWTRLHHGRKKFQRLMRQRLGEEGS